VPFISLPSILALRPASLDRLAAARIDLRVLAFTAGVAPAVEHLVAQRLRRGELSRVDAPGCKLDACWHVTLLERQHQSVAASSFRRYLGTPEAMHLMRSPAGGVPPSRFRPPVYVTIWS
jgi:hypothetical protein